ncbi:hypothetical protein ACFYP4_03515 [Streptomyces sp. NPDC005551]|uniref:hypothetical protein n=1 Tax=Streptomyces sp. NPDC005551 TaxID=3364725 RepID=UPI0036CD7FF4
MGDNPERLNTEASFAALCGVSPIEGSSGCASIPATRRTTSAAPRRAKPVVRSSVASSDMPPARCSTSSSRSLPNPCYRGVRDR